VRGGDAGHGEGTRGVVAQVVEGEVLEPKAPDQSSKAPGEDEGFSLGENRGLRVEGPRESLDQVTEGVSHRYRA